ncbi:MAG: tRNA-dihydrouridine synthase [Bacteroidetes bacterium]|nr:tRNA-dihydrouridine synthase [Bacteroidota bacterium]
MVKISDIELGDFPLLLAPMEDVSDPPFRAVCKAAGADMMEYERPIGIQIFGSEIESMKEATVIATAVNPDLIDINYGCPVKAVACKGAGAGILKDIPKMVAMTQAIIDSTHLPVTVKTRLGWDDSTKNIEEVAERLQDIGIAALTIHGRTRVQMYKGSADWRLIAAIKNNPRIHIPIFGNGDVDTPEKALLMKETFGVDGIMIGRASIGYPWIFREVKHYLNTGELLAPPTVEERVSVCRQHLSESMKWKGEKLGLLEMRRHYHSYFKGFANFKSFREKLVSVEHYEEMLGVLQEIENCYEGGGVLAAA